MMIGFMIVAFSLTVVLVGMAMWNASKSLQDLSKSLLERSSRATANSIESGIRTKIALLKALDAHNAVAGHSSRAAAADVGIQNIVNIGPDSPVASLFPDTFGKAASAGPIVSDLYYPPGSRDPRIAIAIPAHGRGKRLLALTVSPHILFDDMDRNSANADSLLFAVTDSAGRIIARSRDPEKYVGQRAPDWAKIQAAGGDSGTFLAQTTEGKQIMFAFRKLRHTPGWVVVVGEPLDKFDGRWMTPVYAVFVANIIGLVLVLAATIAMARIILMPVKQLAAYGRRVAAGESTEPPRIAFDSPVREFEDMRQSLVAAEKALRRQTNAAQDAMRVLAISEHRYRALAEAGALVSYQTDAEGNMVALSGWRELTGVPDDAAIDCWSDSIHSGDWPGLKAAMGAAFDSQTLLNEEFRLRTAAGDWRWVRAHGAPVRGAKGEVIEWVGVLEDVHERRQAQEKIHHLAHHDSLTGLRNRTYLQERLPQLAASAARAGKRFAIHLVDIDKFKDVNDSEGHAAGDRLLTSIAQTLNDASHGAGFVARLGGDEFVVVQADVADDDHAYAFGEKLRNALRDVPSNSAASGFISASLGYAIYPQDSDDPDQLMRNADIALYHAKTSSMGKTCGFTVEMAAQIQLRRELEKDLFRAVTTRSPELQVFYQPQIRVSDRKLVGFEALARWTHPTHGAIAPDVFIAIAEEAGFIEELGGLVLRQACIDATQWRDDLTIAVNLSAVEVMRIDLPSVVHSALLETGLRPSRLELEVTESVLIRDRDLTLNVLRRLKAQGVGIAMDDFGTGYSSLEYLHIFPFDKVKIDRVFVNDVAHNAQARAIVRSVVGLGQAIGFETIAEGVEHEDQFAVLADMNCNYIQGFLFGKPADFHQTLAAIARRDAA